MDYKAFVGILEKYLRLATYPVGVKMLKTRDDIPQGVQSVAEALNHKIALCQGFGLARRNGLTLAMFKEDMNCPNGLAVMGLVDRPDYIMAGDTNIYRYTRTMEAAARTEAEMLHFEKDEFAGLVTGPLESVDFDVDLAIVYGNAAQVTRLMQASMYEKGGRFELSVIPSAVCADLLVPPAKDRRCGLGFPCWGDRINGGTSNDELAFSIPVEKFEEIAFGLEQSHQYQYGMKLPIPLPVNYEAAVPGVYNRYVDDLGLR